MSDGTLNLIVTQACNLRCRSCINGDDAFPGMRMTLEEARRYVDEAATAGIRKLHFSGGEPFLMRGLLVTIARHAASLGFVSTATTSCYWARSPEEAREVLASLVGSGLVGLGVSIDEFHEEFVAVERVRHALVAARDLGVICRIQAAVIAGSKNIAAYRTELDVEAPGLFHWQDISCLPVGFAADKLPRERFLCKPGIPMGDCTLGRYVTVFPDGSVTLCSTSRASRALVVGDLRVESLRDIQARAGQSPLLAALRLWFGPRLLGELARDAGRADLADGPYAHECHACYTILEDDEAVAALIPRLNALADDLHHTAREQADSLARLKSRRLNVIRAPRR